MMNLIKNVISEVDKQREDMIEVIENLVQFVDPIDYEGENSSQGRTNDASNSMSSDSGTSDD
jgi:hypothetical protein